ncbi:MAG: prepilin-type N-terminal cleavage/methylation domain-containing protein [Butyrivibrio sp.]|nr:prepilin-type N-terminal cleavage/methylation domain-containing protein [Butyrivibrio sp.]
MCQKKHRQNNKGFSIVELIVVVAIMSVMIGAISITYTVVKRTNVTKAARTIDDLLTTCREKAMTNSAKEWKVVIDDHTAKIIKVDSEGNEIEIESAELPSNIEVYVSEVSVSEDDEVKAGAYYAKDKPISISFKLLSGEVSSVYAEETIIKGESTNCGIVCEYKNKKRSTITLYYATGKHTID